MTVLLILYYYRLNFNTYSVFPPPNSMSKWRQNRDNLGNFLDRCFPYPSVVCSRKGHCCLSKCQHQIFTLNQELIN